MGDAPGAGRFLGFVEDMERYMRLMIRELVGRDSSTKIRATPSPALTPKLPNGSALHQMPGTLLQAAFSVQHKYLNLAGGLLCGEADGGLSDRFDDGITAASDRT
jgi:hypothetical protein